VKKPTKKKPAPKPIIAWAIVDDGKIHGEECWNTRADALWFSGNSAAEVIRVRIVPVAVKRRKGGN
jgi:hypothetical protein